MASCGTIAPPNERPSSVMRLAVGRCPATEKAGRVLSVSAIPTTPGASVASAVRSEAAIGRRLIVSDLRSRPVAPGPSRSSPRGWAAACTTTGSRATIARSIRTLATRRSSSAWRAMVTRAGAMPTYRTVSWYCPPPSGKTMVNRPRASVVRWRDTWVSRDVACTTAPARGWLSRPVTVPVMMSVVVPTWVAAVRGRENANSIAPASVPPVPPLPAVPALARAPRQGPGAAAPQWRLTLHAGAASHADSVVALGARAGQPEAVQVGVRPLRSQQLSVRAALPHAASLEVEDQVRPSGKLQVVGDEERGPPLRQPLQRFEDGPFVFAV